MKIGVYGAVAAIILLLGGTAWVLKGKTSVEKTLDLVRARIGTKKVIPDPAKIETTGDWYFLDHISSGLCSFDHEKNEFVPNIAEAWTITGKNTHVFKLRKDLQFSDGSLITAEDIEWSIKRLLIKKTSTHLPLWKYIVGCESLQKITDSCEGLKINADGNLEIALQTRSESFFLQMASPETGIWSKTDINPDDLSIKPTKFSGPYKIKTQSDRGFLLERNENSLISKNFPDSPKQIELISMPIVDAENALQNGQIDLLLRSHNPFGEKDMNQSAVQVHKTAPSTIVYFHSVHNNENIKLIGQDFLKALWEQKADEALPAKTVLPFTSKYSLSQQEFLNEFPTTSAKVVKIGKPWNFYSEKFISLLIGTAKQLGIDLQMIELTPAEWSAAFEDPKASSKIDFILSPYVASERYPAVQLRFITGQMKTSPVDLLKAETPDLTQDKIDILKQYQRWLLASQSAVPLFFTRMHIYHSAQIDVGAQSKTDGEIELWRLTKKEK